MIAIEGHLADTERNRVDPLELSQDLLDGRFARARSVSLHPVKHLVSVQAVSQRTIYGNSSGLGLERAYHRNVAAAAFREALR